MADAYTVFWTTDRWLGAVAVGPKPLPVLFGGPHPSEPSFRRAGVKVGDTVYPIAIANRRMYLVARMRVREMLLLGQEDGPGLIEHRFPQYRPWKFLAPTCTEEVVVGMEGTVPRTDLDVPTDVLERLTFRSQRGERSLKQVKDGELTSSLSLHGIYRLAAGSAADFAAVFDTPTPAGRRTADASDEALF